jgi:hypothetical protein
MSDQPEVKLTDEEITGLETWNKALYYRRIADAASIKAARACWQLMEDCYDLSNKEFRKKYGKDVDTIAAHYGDNDALAAWLRKQGIEVTE